MADTTTIHGCRVTYEQNAYDGIRYLRDDLETNEAKVFFDQAHLKGSAQFEDDAERQFTLLYDRGAAAYVLVRR